MNELANKVIAFCQRENVGVLHAEFLGDFLTGIIHGATIAQAQEDIKRFRELRNKKTNSDSHI